jgi:signal transduction histidine kinase/DNA-binding NarL/FixJ family response regulator
MITLIYFGFLGEQYLSKQLEKSSNEQYYANNRNSIKLETDVITEIFKGNIDATVAEIHNNQKTIISSISRDLLVQGFNSNTPINMINDYLGRFSKHSLHSTLAFRPSSPWITDIPSYNLSNEDILSFDTSGKIFTINQKINGYIVSGKYLKHLDTFVLVVKDSDSVESKIKAKIIETISNISKIDKTYIWVIDESGNAIFNHYSQFDIETNVLNHKDLSGKEFIKDILNEVKSKNEGFTTYNWTNPKTSKKTNKTVYFKKIDSTDWIIGNGFFHDDTDISIASFNSFVKSSFYKISILGIIIIICIVAINIYATILVYKNFKKRVKKLSDIIQARATKFQTVNHNDVFYEEFDNIATSINYVTSAFQARKSQLEKAKSNLFHTTSYLQSILDSTSSIGILALDGGLKVKFFNGTAEKLLKLKLNGKLSDFISEIALFDTDDNRISITEIIDNCYENIKIQDKRGCIRFFEITIKKLSLDDHEEYLVLFREITKSYNQIKTLEHLSDTYKRLLEAFNTNIAFLTIDINNQITFASNSSQKIIGVDKDTAFSDLTVEHSNPYILYDSLKKVQTTKDIVSGELTMNTLSNGKRNIKAIASPVFDENENVIAYDIMAEDITESKQQQIHLFEQQVLLQKIINTVPYQIIVRNYNGEILVSNLALQKVHNLDKSPKSIYDLYSPQEAEIIVVEDREIIKNNIEFTSKVFEIPKVDQESKWYKSNKFPFFYYGETVILEVIREITKQVTAEQKLISAKRTSDLASRMKSEFLANMSHEIRTPMNAILGFSQIMEEQLDDPKHQEFIKAILGAGKSLLAILNDILDISKIEAGRLILDPHFFALSDLLNNIRNIFHSKLEQKNIEFVTNIDNRLSNSIYLDEVRLQQAISNLVGNAVKFTDSGEIRIEIEAVNYSHSKSTSDVRISVSDSGMGIPLEEQDSIFEMFIQQKNQSQKQFGGTGLGLSITKKLINMMNGSIFVKSIPNKGSTFVIHLKNVPFVEVEDSDKISQVEEFDKQSKILLVSNISINNSIIAGMLDEEAFDLHIAPFSDKCCENFKSELFDLVTFDLDSSKNLKLLRKFKSFTQYRPIPIIAISSHSMKHEVASYLEAGADLFLPKPLVKDDFKKSIVKLVSERNNDEVHIDFRELQALENKKKNEISLALKDIEYKVSILREMIIFEDAESLGTEISKIGQVNNLATFTSIGLALKKAAENFDIDKINLTFDNFERIAKFLKI